MKKIVLSTLIGLSSSALLANDYTPMNLKMVEDLAYLMPSEELTTYISEESVIRLDQINFKGIGKCPSMPSSFDIVTIVTGTSGFQKCQKRVKVGLCDEAADVKTISFAERITCRNLTQEELFNL